MHQVLLIVPTLNASEIWPRFIEGVKQQTTHPAIDLHVLVIDSGSSDDTVKLALEAGFEVQVIKTTEFDHGGTRQHALGFVKEGQAFALFMTQDAIFARHDALMEMLMAFEDPQTALVYGRQLPHIGASPLAAQARLFNYPEYSLVKRYEDRATMGIKSAFCSNSFAMYRIHALQAVGGFPLKTILGEDMLVAAKLLKSGYAVRYEAKAQVFHSHNYSCIQEFKRYFDTGVFHFESRMILDEFGGIGSEGMKHFRAQLDLLDGIHGLRKVIFLIDVVFRNTLKYVGYQLGRHHNRLPIELKKSFSMFKGYWNH